MALCSDNTVRAWGDNTWGQLGNGNNTSSNVPVQVSNLTGVVALSSGDVHSLALKNDGTVWAWGDNLIYNQLGNGNNTNSNVPVQVSNLIGVVAIAGGGDHSLALKNDGTVWVWGNNGVGQYGNGNTTISNVPVQVSFLTGIVAIASGNQHSLALKNDGTVWSWGWNLDGQLGNGNNVIEYFAVQVSGLTGVVALAGGVNHSLALKNDGTVWSWGGNFSGQLGNGNNGGSNNVPAQVSGLTGVVAIVGANYFSLALKNDGTVRAWGYNLNGQLGNGNNTDSYVPVQVSGLSGVVAIAGGASQSLALKNDGTVWAWGNNPQGQLGTGNNTSSNVPVQVTGLCNGTSAIEENSIENTITVFPNPFSTETVLKTDNSFKNASLTIYNSTGQVVKQMTPINSEAGKTVTLFRDNLPSGLYFIRLTQNNKSYIVKLVITD